MIRKLATLSLVTCCAFTLVALVMHLLGNTYFLLDAEIDDVNFMIRNVVNFFLLLANSFFLLGAVLQTPPKETFYHSLKLTSLTALMALANLDLTMMTFLNPLCYCFAVAPKKETLKRFAKVSLIIIIYQAVSIYIKFNVVSTLQYLSPPLIPFIQFNVDGLIFMALIWIVEGGDKYVYMGNARQLVPAADDSGNGECSEEAEEVAAKEYLNSLSTKDRNSMLFIMLSIQVFQIMMVLVLGFIGNVILELLIILMTWFIMKSAVPKVYHADSVLKCTILSMLLFYIAAKITLPLSVSMFFTICIGVIVTVIMYLLQDHIDEDKSDKRELSYLRERVKELIALGEIRPFNVDDCTEEELRERCKELRISRANTDFAVRAFIQNLDRSSLAEQEFISLESTYVKISRLKKTLNTGSQPNQ